MWKDVVAGSDGGQGPPVEEGGETTTDEDDYKTERHAPALVVACINGNR